MNEQGLYDIYDFWHVPFWHTLWFKVVMCCAFASGLLGLFFIAWQWFCAHKKKRPLWECALKDINALREKDLDNPVVRRVVYDEMTRLLKEYSVQRYGWDVGGLTDKEFIIFLTNKQVDLRVQHAFEKIAHGCEYIKFADENVNRDRVLADCALSEEFIRATIPSEQR